MTKTAKMRAAEAAMSEAERVAAELADRDLADVSLAEMTDHVPRTLAASDIADRLTREAATDALQ